MADEIRNANDADPFKGNPTFSFRNRLVRVLWSVTWSLLGSWTPPPLRRWRLFLLRQFGAKLHITANVYGSVKVWHPANLEMGPYATLGPGVICYAMAPISVGHHAVVSQRAHLCCGTHDICNPTFQLHARPIVIGANSWICAEAFVGPGVTVGEGAVLAARGATFTDLAPWKVYRGNPASLIKDRPSFVRDLP